MRALSPHFYTQPKAIMIIPSHLRQPTFPLPQLSLQLRGSRRRFSTGQGDTAAACWGLLGKPCFLTKKADAPGTPSPFHASESRDETRCYDGHLITRK